MSPLPPGPRLSTPLQTLSWVMRPGPFLDDCERHFGPVFTVRFAVVGKIVMVSDPALVKQVFTADQSVLRAGEANRVLEPLLGPRSVLLLDGSEHLRQRRLLLPPFHGERTARYGELMTELAAAEVDRWPVGEAFPVLERMQAITLEVILQVVFGEREPARLQALRRGLRRLLNDPLQALSQIPWLRMLPLGLDGRFVKARTTVDELLYDMIARRREAADLDERDDILSVLMAARDEDGAPLTDSELRDELMTLLIAGHETTATTLAWAFERLLRNPEALVALTAEARDGAGDAYADAVARETLRLRPPVPIVARRVKAPFELDGWEIEPGMIVSPCIHLIHRRPDMYPEPLEFRPERFLDRAPDTYAWLPFGGGVRRCLGATFALFEMRRVLQAVFARAELRAEAPDDERVRRRGPVLAPRGGGTAVLVGRLERELHANAPLAGAVER